MAATLTSTGYAGAGNGSSGPVNATQMWRGTSVQVCGMFPFTTAAGTPLFGAPLGRHLHTGGIVCFDPIAWFEAKLISNPSVFVLGLNGRGKSTMIGHMMTCLAGFGVLPVVLGDLKPDYVDLITALGGQVNVIGPGRGALNPLDNREAVDAAKRLRAAIPFQPSAAKLAEQIEADSLARRASLVSSLVAIGRRGDTTDQEDAMIEQALRLLDETFTGTPVLADLLQVVASGPPSLREVVLDDGDDNIYRQRTLELRGSLGALVSGGKLSTLFAGQTAAPMRRDVPVVFDISSIPDSRAEMTAAALMCCWTIGFGIVNIAHALADADLEPERHYLLVLDEMWRALRAGHGMADRIDSVSRLNRTMGVGQVMISHTMADLLALPVQADIMKARGLVERAGAVLLGPLPRGEMSLLTDSVPLSDAEQEELVSWAGQAAWGRREQANVVPGMGQFMLKVGGRPGIPIRVQVSEFERSLHDTNARWHEGSRIGKVNDASATTTVPDERPVDWTDPYRSDDASVRALERADGNER